MAAYPQPNQVSLQQTPPTQNPNTNPQLAKKTPSPLVSLFGVILVTLIVFLAGYFYLTSLQEKMIGDKKAKEAQEKRLEEVRLAQQTENTKNDQIRKIDITTLKGGLEKYFDKNKKYPKSLEELTPDYLQIITLDPVTKEPYDYVPNEDFSQYTLSAKLGDGTSYSVKSD